MTNKTDDRWKRYGKWKLRCRLQYCLDPKPLPPISERLATIERIIAKHQKRGET